ncbi:MAG: helix-turn-helix domain-containing protein [Candidatus Saccharibacteria bacterium]
MNNPSDKTRQATALDASNNDKLRTMKTVQEVSAILGTRKEFVYDLIYTGRLRAFRISERRFRISEEALHDFIRQEEARFAENISCYTGCQSTKEAD